MALLGKHTITLADMKRIVSNLKLQPRLPIMCFPNAAPMCFNRKIRFVDGLESDCMTQEYADALDAITARARLQGTVIVPEQSKWPLEWWKALYPMWLVIPYDRRFAKKARDMRAFERYIEGEIHRRSMKTSDPEYFG